MVALRRAVFLDRDGVINDAPVQNGKSRSPQSLNELRILPGVSEALQRLRGAGFLNVVVTNQPDVGSGKVARSVVEAMHRQLVSTLALDLVKVCWHTDAENCTCRKPKPGMILEAAVELGIDPGKSFMIGDRWRDVGAAHAAGCRAFFIDYRYAEQPPDPPYVAVNSLAQAAQLILQLD